MFAHCCITAALLLLCAGTTSGQTPSERSAELRDALVAEVRAQLRSGDPETIAWGAHRAAEHRLFACRDDVRAALRRFAKDDPDPFRYAAHVVLDALVQTVATVPVDELEPFFELPPAVALLLRDEHGTDVLVRAFRAQPAGSTTWRACGNALVTRGSTELVLDVLKARIAPLVQVHDGEPIEGLKDSGSIACSFDREHIGWPSFPRYGFTFAPEAGSHVVCGGPFPVFRTRDLRVSAGGCQWSGEYTLAEARASWLTHLLGKEHEQAVRAIDRERTLRWRDAASYAADVRALRAAMEADWRAVVTACAGAKLIPADAAKDLAPEIVLGEWNLLDGRNDRQMVLPEVEGAAAARR